MAAFINCDMGESFGLYKMGDETGIMPHIAAANVACGFHASDPNHMYKTVELAKQHSVKVGAHFSLPDLTGFGRREMKIEREELRNIILYQVGALKGFLDFMGISLHHLKPHGALYGMASRQEDVAHAVADVGEYYKVPVFGLAGTMHETVYRERGLEFYAEFFADLEYDKTGKLIITREHKLVDPQYAAERSVRAVKEGLVTSVEGTDVEVQAQTVCVHSDTSNSVNIVKAVKNALLQI